MKSKDISIRPKEANIMLKNQNKVIRWITKTLGVAKSNPNLFILKRKECRGNLDNHIIFYSQDTPS